MRIILLAAVVLSGTCSLAQSESPSIKNVEVNEMKVSWYYADSCLRMNLKAPAEGWVAVGFHEESSLVGAYFVMGMVDYGTVIVAEHYTHRNGHYERIRNLDGTNQIRRPGGEETVQGTEISFSLPIRLLRSDQYRKSIRPGQVYYLTLAYSHEDDFQHHSAMRTSVRITL